MRLFHFVVERGGQVQLRPVAASPEEFGSPLAVFEQTQTHERQVTKWINELFELAIKEQDHATRVHLQWFVTEQVEEEDVAGEIIDNLKLAGENKTALLMLDRDFRHRTADVPATSSSWGLAYCRNRV